MKIRVLIVDDEPLAREGVLLRIERHTDIEVVGECGNGSDAIRSILSLKPDLVFLDIKMPKVTGFDVINAVGVERMPTVIFLTAYDEHAIEAFRIHAADYLLKPVEDERFEESLAHAKEEIFKNRISNRGQQLSELLNAALPAPPLANQGESQTQDRLVIRSGGHVYLLKAEDIYSIKAEGDYVSVHTLKKTHLVRETMKNMEQRLTSQGFQRVHRSCIVNLEYVRELIAQDSGDYQIILRDDTRVKLSRNYRDALYERLNALG
ncbi:LytR/AlgR family response regulator transcription factor [Aliikangiella coralliicola]|uniref:Response regulator n=1 Tax=Aliikangiella coralliicola TaxID=2592383 RepID=A0A545UBM0_9GAMM|nr:LytTR family transcriptional regulator DNA-binding domain-containing protein [Aliikangiella coralliicola]TQV86865.1 response regulator [Aliikangiella coralliicola]